MLNYSLFLRWNKRDEPSENIASVKLTTNEKSSWFIFSGSEERLKFSKTVFEQALAHVISQLGHVYDRLKSEKAASSVLFGWKIHSLKVEIMCIKLRHRSRQQRLRMVEWMLRALPSKNVNSYSIRERISQSYPIFLPFLNSSFVSNSIHSLLLPTLNK